MKNYDYIITGPQGNIGSRLAKRSSENYLEVGRNDWDLLEKSDLSAKCIVHCAFDLKHSYSHNPYLMIDSNLSTTAKLLEIAKKNKIKKIIFISSCAVYGNSSNTSEKNICIPISINGQLKLLNERIIESFCNENNITFHIFRVFNLFGGDDHFSVVSKILQSAKLGNKFTLNNQGLSQRDFIHVDDVCDIILETVRKNLSFTHLNLGTGVATKICDLFTFAQGIARELSHIETANLESEYSRADLTEFNLFFHKKFINVFDYLERELKLQSTSIYRPIHAGK